MSLVIMLKGKMLNKTDIPVSGTEEGRILFLVEDIMTFLHTQIGKVRTSPI